MRTEYDSLVTEPEEGSASFVESGVHGKEEGVVVVEERVRGHERGQLVQQLTQPLSHR